MRLIMFSHPPFEQDNSATVLSESPLNLPLPFFHSTCLFSINTGGYHSVTEFLNYHCKLRALDRDSGKERQESKQRMPDKVTANAIPNFSSVLFKLRERFSSDK